MIETSRRSFIRGALSALAAPAIVRYGALMPVRGIIQSAPEEIALLLKQHMADAYVVMRANISAQLYGEGLIKAIAEQQMVNLVNIYCPLPAETYLTLPA